MNFGTNAMTILRAQAVATEVMKVAGVALEFRNGDRPCATSGIVIGLSYKAPAEDHPGALAYAMAYQGSRITVFYDRVLVASTAAGAPYLLGHVIAHEVTHLIQGVERHSASGLMKKKWSYSDYLDMQRRRLGFDAEDLLLIQRGLDFRAGMHASGGLVEEVR
jgi:hypothetical protein